MQVITLGSGKGGVGKSFLAVNLGLALAQRGMRTCLVDLNFAAADLHLLLGRLQPRRGILEYLRGEAASMSDVLLPAKSELTLSLVPGAGETVRASGLSAREIDSLAHGLRRLPADIVIVDLQGGAANQVLDLFLAGDLPLVVTTPDAVALSDAAKFLRLARVRQAAHGSTPVVVPRSPRVYTSLDELVRDMSAIRAAEEAEALAHGFRPGLILNRCRAADHARDELLRRLRHEVGEEVEWRLCCEIPEDEAVDRSMRLLAPVVELAPAAPVSRTIVDLANTIGGCAGKAAVAVERTVEALRL